MISLNVNGSQHDVDVDAATPLLYVLRDNLALNNPPVRLRARTVRCVHCAVKITAVRN